MFRDRNDAAEQLAENLELYKGKPPLVLAIPADRYRWRTHC